MGTQLLDASASEEQVHDELLVSTITMPEVHPKIPIGQYPTRSVSVYQRGLAFLFIRLKRISFVDQKSIAMQFFPISSISQILGPAKRFVFPAYFENWRLFPTDTMPFFSGFSAGQKIRSGRMALFLGENAVFWADFLPIRFFNTRKSEALGAGMYRDATVHVRRL
jgi:hypothetical protein